MQTIILIDDMQCEHCAAKIDHALSDKGIHYTAQGSHRRWDPGRCDEGTRRDR